VVTKKARRWSSTPEAIAASESNKRFFMDVV